MKKAEQTEFSWKFSDVEKEMLLVMGSNPRPSHPQLTAFPFIHVNIVRKVLILVSFESDIRIMSSRSEKMSCTMAISSELHVFQFGLIHFLGFQSTLNNKT